jgi:hypothetical protein
LFIDEAENVRAMHWMTEGDWYHITFDEFATRFSYVQADKDRIRTHLHNPLDENEMKFMYASGEEGNVGTINGLYTFYLVLNMLFRKTICPRDEDLTNISQFVKNLLAHMRDGAPPFSMMDFVWEEIKGISMNPQKTCSFAPYLMFMIEDITNMTFSKDGLHMPIRPTPSKSQLSPLLRSPLQDQIPLLSSSIEQQNQSDRQGLPVRSVGVTRGSPPPYSGKNPPPPSRNCLGSSLACVTLTMPLREGSMRKENL